MVAGLATIREATGNPPDMAPTPLPPAPAIARPITIQSANHGFFVSVGCQSFAVESLDALLHRLGTYLRNPSEIEHKWLAGEWKF